MLKSIDEVVHCYDGRQDAQRIMCGANFPLFEPDENGVTHNWVTNGFGFTAVAASVSCPDCCRVLAAELLEFQVLSALEGQ